MSLFAEVWESKKRLEARRKGLKGESCVLLGNDLNFRDLEYLDGVPALRFNWTDRAFCFSRASIELS